MKKFNFHGIIFMLILSIVFTASLAIINEITRDRIQLNMELRRQNSLLYVLGFPVRQKTAIEVSNTFASVIQEAEKDDMKFYKAFDNEELIGYIFPFSGDAVWGYLTGFIALSPDFKEIVGVDFLSHSETPGLGGRIDETEFKEQFRGVKLNTEENLNFIVFRPNPGGQVDAITGATGTSNAVIRIINNNLKEILNVAKGEFK